MEKHIENKKVLYNFWGYLSDKINISSPDGNATYTPWILNEFLKRGYEVFVSPIDRDKDSYKKYNKEVFKSFSQEKRLDIYKKIKNVDLENLPSLDYLILEWRFPTKDNQERNSPDLKIQNKLIDFYKDKDTKIIIFDLDYQFNESDEEKIKPYKVLETALYPKRNHTSVFIPFDFEELNQFPTLTPKNKVSYIGNDYNRREDIEKKLIPFAIKNNEVINFYGNWLKEDKKELREKWKGIKFNGRVGFNEFRNIYKNSLCVPLLLTNEYKERGFMTMRILETILFGSIPIGFDDFRGIEKFLPDNLIVKENNFEEKYEEIKNLGFFERIKLREELIDRLKFMDVKFFVDEILK